MDLNVKIIEGIKQFPSLYDNSGDLDERNHAWMQLADKLDVHVQVLQIRWHALLQMYHRDSNFKYSSRMQFIYRNEERQSKEDNWPEFVINDEYLKGCNIEDQEEFIYLDTEEESNSQSLRSSKDNNDCHYAEVTANKDLVDRREDSSATDKVNKEVNRISKKGQLNDDNKVKSCITDKHDISNDITSREKEDVAGTELSKNSNTRNHESKEKTSIGERCEDVIFGELVSAMLKRMDENKKKSIKKEIMNLLFS